MGIPELKNKIERLKSSLERTEIRLTDEAKKAEDAKKVYGFKDKKARYYFSFVETGYNELKKSIFELASEAQGQEPVFELILLWGELQKNKGNVEKLKGILDRMSVECSKINLTQKEQKIQSHISLKIPKLPEDIKSDVLADIREIEKCFNNGLYRSATILCGRVLETVLHRKYYEATGNDALEKSPGIGLGNLIAKLKEKNIEIDPAITQQIHLINQVRVFTVHKKKEAFMPSKEQCHAIILYTMDVVGRIFVG